MPAGKELATFQGEFTSVQIREINGEERVIVGAYQVQVSGQLSGLATGTITFTGINDRGTCSDLGIGYLDSGEVLSARGQGVYWLSDKGQWEFRGAYLLGDQTVVSEGQITLANGTFSLGGKVLELT